MSNGPNGILAVLYEIVRASDACKGQDEELWLANFIKKGLDRRGYKIAKIRSPRQPKA